MIHITKMVDDHSVNEKLDLEALQKQLPEIKENVSVTLVATKRKRLADEWVKNGTKYYSIILDYNKILTSTKEAVLEMMKKRTLETLSL